MIKLTFWKMACAALLLCAATAMALPAQTFTTLFSSDTTDGGGPVAGLVQGTNGSLYGVTGWGGSGSCRDGCGTVFKITPSGKLTTLHQFDITDRSFPRAPLVQATDGSFYGTTWSSTSDETVFKIAPNGALTTLHNFCSQSGCADGQMPWAPLVQAANGNFYGTTLEGGGLLGITLALFGPLGGLTPRALAQNPVPMINQPLVPDATAPGGPQFTLTINGTGFVPGSVVIWNGSALATTFVSGSRLTAAVPAADIATASTASVTVVDPAPGGGASNTLPFSVQSAGSAVAFALSTFTVANYPGQMVAADFNGDGKLDLAVGAGGMGAPDGVSVLLGDGNGNFNLASSTALGFYPFSMVAGDFNGDGKLDLAAVNQVGNSVAILLGDGTGNFTLVNTIPSDYTPKFAVVGDFNGDGKLDLAVTNLCGSSSNCYSPSPISILLGDGTGNFTPASNPPYVNGPLGIAAGDFNGDGKLDLAVIGNSAISILQGDGTGHFSAGWSTTITDGPYSIATGDVNGDGVLDLVTGNGAETCSVLLGDGTGNFTLSGSVPECGEVTVLLADFNGDGKLDLVSYDQFNPTAVNVLLGDGTGNFTHDTSQSMLAYGLAVGDFNGDGKPDIVAPNWNSNTVSVLLQVPPSPIVALSPSSLSFDTQRLGTASIGQNATLTNTGTAALDITTVAASANFNQTNDCGLSVTPGESCTLTVTFRPRTTGNLAGEITIADNASNTPQTISLTGTGTGIALRPSQLNFLGQKVGTTSLPRTITLTNLASRSVSIAGIRLTGVNPGDFAETNTCGSSVPAAGSCTFSVTFTPQAQGLRVATLNIADTGGASPQQVDLSGTGK